jgi:hypothetical protein
MRASDRGESTMKEDVFNTSIRKLLKEFGVTAQREIEKALRQAVAEHQLEGIERLPAKLTLSIPTVGLTFNVEGDVDLG